MAQLVDDVCSSSNFSKKGGESADNSGWVSSVPCRAKVAGECSASDTPGSKCGRRFWHSLHKLPLNSSYKEIRPLSGSLQALWSTHLRRISDTFISIGNRDPHEGSAVRNRKIHKDIQMVGILCIRYLSVPIYHDPRSASTNIRRLIPAASSSNFLDFCYLCKQRLDPGNDIFIYRGDRAFCSLECRYDHIVLEEQSKMGSFPSVRSKSIFRSISQYNLNSCDEYRSPPLGIPSSSSSSYSFPR